VSTKHVIDELSAYIDGEAENALDIARHLQVCEACARHHLQLLKLSTHVQALPKLEAHPGFRTRVLAEVAQTSMRAAPWRIHFGVPQMAFAALFLAILTIGVMQWQQDSGPSAAQKLVQEAAPWVDEELVVIALQRLDETGADLSLFESSAEHVDTDDLLDVSIDDVMNLLAENVQYDIPDDVVLQDFDLYTAMEKLDVQETQQFEALLSDYINKG
jgi:predicted anti-sigma-YlaC factor YlaD